MCFPVNFVKFLRTIIFKEHLRTTASKYIYCVFKRPQVCNFIKKENLAQVFSCELLQNFKEHVFLHNASSGYFWDVFKAESF